MATSVNDIYVSVQKQVQKELSTGYLDPAQFNSFANQAVVELFNKYASEFQNTSRVTDKILPFIISSVQPVDSIGKMIYPADYVNKVAIRAFDPDALDAATLVCDADPDLQVNYNSLPQIKVKIIDNDKLGDRLSSSILKPDKYHPIVTFYYTFLKVNPITIGSIVFDYLKQPAEVVWAYTTDTYGLEVYDAANSVDFEFNWLMRNELIVKICSYFGVSVRESELVQASQLMEAQQA